MSDILLAKPKLPPGSIDFSVGEPYVIRKHLFDMFTWDEDVSGVDLSYPFPQGYEPLVKMLEDKHQAPIIITNGAKQALGATFYALHKMGKAKIGMRNPYWALIPPLAKMHGLKSVFSNQDDVSLVKNNFESYLCLAPNNPDGWMPNDLENLYLLFKDHNIPFIHDAAYYSNLYLQGIYPADKKLGDVQIFTFSKSLGLSGLRLGYAVCHNTEMYKHILSYMENMTVGVSTISQRYLFSLLQEMNRDQELLKLFELQCYNSLLKNKESCLKINSEILEVPTNIKEVAGMFGWYKLGPKINFNKAKIHTVSGEMFGDSSMVRLNLAFESNIIEELVTRLNSL